MAEFIFLIRGGYEVTSTFTPEQMQNQIAKYRAWSERLAKEGKLVSAFKLKDDGGRLMSMKGGQIAIDGPLPETKETIGGYFVVKAADYAEATEMAKVCPIFEEGGSVEVRQIEM
jgi:hypothetical protein